MVEIATVIEIIRGQERGKDLIELPSALGGLLVDEETLTIAADLDLVLERYQEKGREKREFFVDVLLVIKRAPEDDEDPIEALKTWVEAWLESD